jgi:two-component system, response regulator, stage 0 sporulation protein F
LSSDGDVDAGKVVIVADDEDDVRLLFAQRFRRELRAEQMTFEYASSGREALEILHRLNGSVILVLSDINMPEMSGLDLLEEIRTRFPGIDVFLITAYDSNRYRTRAAEQGAAGYFTKPLDFAALKALLLERTGSAA